MKSSQYGFPLIKLSHCISQFLLPCRLQPFNQGQLHSMYADQVVKDDNDIPISGLLAIFHTTGLRYMIVALDANITTSRSEILDTWRNFGTTIGEWNDRIFVSDLFFQHAHHPIPNLAKFTSGLTKWITRRRSMSIYASSATIAFGKSPFSLSVPKP